MARHILRNENKYATYLVVWYFHLLTVTQYVNNSLMVLQTKIKPSLIISKINYKQPLSWKSQFTLSGNLFCLVYMFIFNFQGTETNLYKPALESMRDLIRSSTTSMTSVPMPLKFLRTHYGVLKESCERMKEGEGKQLCSSIVSVLAMSQSSDQIGPRECLKYCLLSKSFDVGDWGHEYVR